MNTRRFVSGSSCVLAAWLGATFFNDVPEMKYPKLEKAPQHVSVGYHSESALASHSEGELPPRAMR
jgi:hypothetical protein